LINIEGRPTDQVIFSVINGGRYSKHSSANTATGDDSATRDYNASSANPCNYSVATANRVGNKSDSTGEPVPLQ
jgi:hypothetical protein